MKTKTVVRAKTVEEWLEEQVDFAEKATSLQTSPGVQRLGEIAFQRACEVEKCLKYGDRQGAREIAQKIGTYLV